MKLSIVAIGHRMPAWVSDGFATYQQRLPKHFYPDLVEIPAVTRGASMPAARAMQREGEKMLKAIPSGAHVVALDEHGEQWTSKRLSRELEQWQQHQHVSLLIGGADGLSAECKQRARQSWALSKLTLPHGMVRVLLCEQIYRGWTLLQGHPYHRE